MKKVIQKKTYNTQTAELRGSYTEGAFGQESGFEERLYETKRGYYFLYGIGGSASKYPEETIIPLSPEEAAQWESLHR